MPETVILLTPKELAQRWACSMRTITRRERAGLLKSMRLSRMHIRYRLVDVEEFERQAGGVICLSE